jgi:Protein of unknown function (DUF1761)
MAFAGINYTAVLLAAIASFLFGGIWYGVLSRRWMAAVEKTKEQVSATGMTVPMITTGIALLVMAWVLAGVIGHLGKGQVTPRNGAISGAAYQGAKRALTLIDGAHWLGVLVLQGLVIGWIGVR